MNDRPLKITGRAVPVVDGSGKLVEDIDTDMIFHNAHLAVTDIEEMGKYAFGNLDGWHDFPSKARRGDILLVGRNFGCGSSRQQALDCFRALGVAALVGVSFGAIYFRNAVNAGFPIVTCPSLADNLPPAGETVTLDLVKGLLLHKSGAVECTPLSGVQMEIYKAGGLLNLAT